MYDIIFTNGTILGADDPVKNGYAAVKNGIIIAVGRGEPSCRDTSEAVDIDGDFFPRGLLIFIRMAPGTAIL